eukprot:CAMPEP_0184293400 /NCGR_PEP_ID=MMETSP1049-20130417/4837_1 /TAXON_ID=77928 /ORGANISM="Proteomonas sulcata, Strain CCMP704" /LENGTH=114 /DNA_ID=CAMNT_0026601367 /DNA_START=92 /DNA_END=436 /DNA_ORIENTATION=+
MTQPSGEREEQDSEQTRLHVRDVGRHIAVVVSEKTNPDVILVLVPVTRLMHRHLGHNLRRTPPGSRAPGLIGHVEVMVKEREIAFVNRLQRHLRVLCPRHAQRGGEVRGEQREV